MAEMSSIDPVVAYGMKCARLLALARTPRFSALVPAIYPIAASHALDFVAAAGAPRGADPAWIAAFARFLADREPGLGAAIEAQCGPPPWIVRSSGHEDLGDFVNAGGYASLPCRSSDELFHVVARVALSGYEERSIQQAQLAADGAEPRPIPCFVQPLITASGQPPDPREAPYLPAATVADLGATLADLHRHHALDALDCEWAIPTNHGLVSATSLTRLDPAGLSGQIAFGFGFASAQNAGVHPNASVFLPPGAAALLWSGALLRRVRPRQTWLVQVRPAPAYSLERRDRVLTAGAAAALSRDAIAVPAEPISPPAPPRPGRFLAAHTLGAAWDAYLRLELADRRQLVVALVEHGAATEHAGLMFREAGIPALAIDLRRIPAPARCVVFDPGSATCFFAATDALPALEITDRRGLMLPRDASLVFDGPVSASDAELEQLAHGAIPAEVADPLAAIPGLTAAVRGAIAARSAIPDPDRWLGEDSGACSPTWLGAALRPASRSVPPASVTDAWPAAARRHAAAVRAVRGLEPPEIFAPRLAAASAADLAALIRSADLRVALQIEQMDRHAGGLRGDLVAGALGAARRLGDAGDPQLVAAVARAVVSLAEALDRLPLHASEDRDACLERILGALQGEPAAIRRRLAILQTSALPPLELARLVAASATDAALEDAILALEDARLGLAGSGDPVAPARRLTAAFARFASRCATHAELAGALELVRGELVDLFDGALKAILGELARDRTRRLHQRYLGLLAEWLAFAGLCGLDPVEQAAVASYRAWIAAHEAEPLPGDYFLADRHWRLSLRAAAGGDPAFDNPHQLQNAIHQWLLARSPGVDPTGLPGRLRELLDFARQWSPTGAKLLRLRPELFELELPMGVHKASFVFTSDAVRVEWTEPPDTPDDQLGRLRIFERLLDRYGAWDREHEFAARSERVIGTWTLFIRAARRDGAALGFDDVRALLHRLRLLFDMAYDLSYLEPSWLPDLATSFAEPAWREIFGALSRYRAAVETAQHHVSLYTLALSTALRVLCLVPGARRAVHDAYVAGFPGARRCLSVLWDELAGQADGAAWGEAFDRIQQIVLLVVAAWPDESFGLLSAPEVAAPLRWIIARNLLLRRDVHGRVARELETAGSPLTELALHCIPHVVVSTVNAGALAERVRGAPRAFRTLKEHLLYRHADVLEPTTCDALVLDLGFVPLGAGPAQEAALAHALARTEPRPRIDIHQGVHHSHL
jgi:hypothetical protein